MNSKEQNSREQPKAEEGDKTPQTLWATVEGIGKEVVEGLLDLVYPPICLLCGAWMEAGALCQVCIARFAPLQPPFCDRCGALLDGNGNGQQVCLLCERGPEPPFAWSQVLGRYGGTLREAIHRFKYEGKTALAQPLGVLLAQSLDTPPSPLLTSTLGDPLTFDAIVPVPLHPSRLRQRGFNQAERLARVVAKERGWNLDATGVIRIRSTRTQALLAGDQRAENVRGAFICRPSQRYRGQSVLVLDDVLTTTATVKEVARVIKEGRAHRGFASWPWRVAGSNKLPIRGPMNAWVGNLLPGLSMYARYAPVLGGVSPLRGREPHH